MRCTEKATVPTDFTGGTAPKTTRNCGLPRIPGEIGMNEAKPDLGSSGSGRRIHWLLAGEMPQSAAWGGNLRF
ncbi:hypothetical protein Pan14r_33300 [Crateriforma conspicua]|uniref:Uncharacterized protein n=1 Tax=Crateriforma conspicua TaxID=2527996 RepID=A0A5C5Y6W1_9PLAN|nr:hypothetical protein Pan14r_33300 [Crateriforma conspicua]